MYNFIIVFIVTNNRLFSRIHFSKIWAHGCIQTGSWRILAFGKTVRRVIVMSCRHLLGVYRLWRVSFQRGIWNFTTRVQRYSWNGSKWRASRRGHGHAGRTDIRGEKVTVPHCIPTPNFREVKPGSYARNHRNKSGGWGCHDYKCYFANNFCIWMSASFTFDLEKAQSDLQSFIYLCCTFTSFPREDIDILPLRKFSLRLSKFWGTMWFSAQSALPKDMHGMVRTMSPIKTVLIRIAIHFTLIFLFLWL